MDNRFVRNRVRGSLVYIGNSLSGQSDIVGNIFRDNVVDNGYGVLYFNYSSNIVVSNNRFDNNTSQKGSCVYVDMNFNGSQISQN